jgi:hypothetical protein
MGPQSAAQPSFHTRTAQGKRDVQALRPRPIRRSGRSPHPFRILCGMGTIQVAARQPPRSRIVPTPYLCEAPPLPPDEPPPLFDDGGGE